jgi:signal transduction histidine kinase
VAIAKRVDWIIFGVRWALIGVCALSALWLTGLSPLDPGFQSAWMVIFGGTIVNAVLFALLIFGSGNNLLTALVMLIADSVIALGWLWGARLQPLPFILYGTLPVLTSALRWGWPIALMNAIIIGCAGIAAPAIALPDLPNSFMPGLIGGIFLLAVGLLVSLLDKYLVERSDVLHPSESPKLRTARERMRTLYELTETFGSTLNYAEVLELALSIGPMSLSVEQSNGSGRVVGLVLLPFEDGMAVAASRGLTRRDEEVVVAGAEGVIGLANRQTEPVFGADAKRDPELKYFAGLQDCQSILALPLQSGRNRFGVLLYGHEDKNAFSDDQVELLRAVGTQVTLALQNAQLYQDVLDEKERIITVEENTRKLLARDLHDGPTQTISVVAVRINYIRSVLKSADARIQEELAKVEDLARQATGEIRQVLFSLRPLVLETQGLVAALKQFATKMKETYQLNVIIEAEERYEYLLTDRQKGVVFYLAEESVNNARKHAESSHIWVRLGRSDDNVILQVEDDGKGFDVGDVQDGYENRGSLGMKNLYERAETIEAKTDIDSAIGQGTTITVTIPIAPEVMKNVAAASMPAPESAAPLFEASRPAKPQPKQKTAEKPAEPKPQPANRSAPAPPKRPGGDKLSPMPEDAAQAPRRPNGNLRSPTPKKDAGRKA